MKIFEVKADKKVVEKMVQNREKVSYRVIVGFVSVIVKEVKIIENSRIVVDDDHVLYVYTDYQNNINEAVNSKVENIKL